MTAEGKIVHRIDPETDKTVRKWQKERGHKSAAETIAWLVTLGAARATNLANYAAKKAKPAKRAKKVATVENAPNAA